MHALYLDNVSFLDGSNRFFHSFDPEKRNHASHAVIHLRMYWQMNADVQPLFVCNCSCAQSKSHFEHEDILLWAFLTCLYGAAPWKTSRQPNTWL
jgi:hypothetical protein